jgi:integrase
VGAPRPKLLDRVRQRIRARHLLELELPWLDSVVRAKRPAHLPVVLTRAETRAVIDALAGTPRSMGLLMYGAGLRLLECCRVRIQDVNLATNQITIRDGKGSKDRTTMLPGIVKGPLAQHIDQTRKQRAGDVTHPLIPMGTPDPYGPPAPRQ